MEDGEFLSEGAKLLHVKVTGDDILSVVTSLDDSSAIGVDDCGATIVMADGIITHTVDANDIALVLYGTGAQQYIPDAATRRRPVGNVQSYGMKDEGGGVKDEGGGVKDEGGGVRDDTGTLRLKQGKRRS